jgi:hypothetical protein
MLNRFLFRFRRMFRPKSSTKLFAFFDGAKWRSADPLAVIYALQKHPTYNDAKHFRLMLDGDQESIEIAVQAVCDVFSVKPYDPETRTGLTIAERVGLLREFAVYVDTVKKNINTTATTPQFTESISSESAEPTMNATSPSP